jgi:hypothetical protein
MKYLSIDPATEGGKKQAYASFIDRKIIDWGRCTLEELVLLIKVHDVVFCEDQYIAFPKDGKRTREWRAKVEGVIRLAQTTGQIERIAKIEGRDFHYIDPGTWQHRILEAGPGIKSKAREQAAIKKASLYIRSYHQEGDIEGKKFGVDIGCAICIGICGIGDVELEKFQRKEIKVK